MSRMNRRLLVLLLAAVPGPAVLADEAADIDEGFVAFQRGDIVAAITHYEAAANAGSAEAQARLGWIFDQSEQNEDAVKWYRASAEQGHAGGQFGLGEMYAKGEGVEQDDAKAVEYFRLAAENGHGQAQRVLANAYENGLLGVEADPDKAAMWNERAARQASADEE